MKKIIGLFFFGTAFAFVLAFGIPGITNASDSYTNGNMILADGFGVSLGDGGVSVGIDKDHPDRDRSYEERRDFERQQEYERQKEYDRDRWNEERRDRDRERANEWDRQ